MSDRLLTSGTSHNILTVIPARGGSKGIPRKNVRFLAGKPLIAHTIQQALKSRWTSRVIVSTDSPEIADVSLSYGAEVVDRPPELSTDSSSSESALLHSLSYLKESEGYEPDLLVFLQCTSPLTLAEDIDGTIQALIETQADTSLAVVPFHYFLWKRDIAGNGIGINHNKKVRLLRQERDDQYLESGAIYVMRARGFIRSQHRFFGKTALYEMPGERCLEIDDPVDFSVAEVLMTERIIREKIGLLPNAISALILDFDGVFTDNRVLVLEDGKEAVKCNRSDEMGLSQLKKRNLPILVLSSEKNNVVTTRCNKLGIECIQGIEDKLKTLKIWLNKNSIDIRHTVYVGNDANDLSCLRAVGCGVAVKDAHPAVIAEVDLLLSASGGEGAIRELTELIIQKLEER